jgi:hypothetical protein
MGGLLYPGSIGSTLTFISDIACIVRLLYPFLSCIYSLLCYAIDVIVNRQPLGFTFVFFPCSQSPQEHWCGDRIRRACSRRSSRDVFHTCRREESCILVTRLLRCKEKLVILMDNDGISRKLSKMINAGCLWVRTLC